MTPKIRLFLVLIILSFSNTLYNGDYLGAAISLALVPMVFLAQPPEKK